MPNWTQNHVAFEGSKEKIVELKELFASNERVFDFNKIIHLVTLISLHSFSNPLSNSVKNYS